MNTSHDDIQMITEQDFKNGTLLRPGKNLIYFFRKSNPDNDKLLEELRHLSLRVNILMMDIDESPHTPLHFAVTELPFYVLVADGSTIYSWAGKGQASAIEKSL
tara:strand:+ start:1972 stop:2283 length:312 start_codon:yes stop_codon:yes gene_type:complete